MTEEIPPDVKGQILGQQIHVLDGLISAFHKREAIARMIWTCRSSAEAVSRWTAEPFGFSESQAHHILDRTLRQQTKEHLDILVARRSALAEE